MTDNNNGFGGGTTSTATAAARVDESVAKQDFVPTAGAMTSNHNSLHEVNPVLTANLAGKLDYNPMRMTPNRANDATDTTMIPESAARLVDAKGDRPTAAEDALNGRDMAGNSDNNVSHDTIVTDPVTRITTRANPKTLADENAEADAAARAA